MGTKRCFICHTLKFDNRKHDLVYDSGESFKLYGTLLKSWIYDYETFGQGLPTVEQIPEKRRHCCQICFESLSRLTHIHQRVQNLRNRSREIVQAIHLAISLKSNVLLEKTVQKESVPPTTVNASKKRKWKKISLRVADCHLKSRRIKHKERQEKIKASSAQPPSVATETCAQTTTSTTSGSFVSPAEILLQPPEIVRRAPPPILLYPVAPTASSTELPQLQVLYPVIPIPHQNQEQFSHGGRAPVQFVLSRNSNNNPQNETNRIPSDPQVAQVTQLPIRENSQNQSERVNINATCPPQDEDISNEGFVSNNETILNAEKTNSKTDTIITLDDSAAVPKENPAVVTTDASSNQITIAGPSNSIFAKKSKRIRPKKFKEVKCCHCDQIFLSHSDLNAHLQIHKRYNCEYCSSTFTRLRGLSNHIYCLHNGLRAYKCDQCPKTWYTKEALDIHIVKSHTKRPPKFVREGPKKCDICGQTYSHKFLLREHKRRVHEGIKLHSCTFEGCTKRFYDRTSRNSHYKTHLPKEDLPLTEICDVCGKGFRNRANLISHASHHKKISERKFKCTFEGCSWAFLSQHGLQKHIYTHTGEKPFACKKCGKTFNHDYTRAKHEGTICSSDPAVRQKILDKYRRISLKARREGKKCPKCYKFFITQEKFDAHMLKHEGDTDTSNLYPFVCDQPGCNGAYKDLRPLLRHKLVIHRISDRSEIYDCLKCKRPLATLQSLKNHLKEVCKLDVEEINKIISEHTPLAKTRKPKEMKIPDEENPALNTPCPYCPRKFSNVYGLKSHIVQNHTESHHALCTHACPHCPKKYMKQYNLDEHVKKVHRQVGDTGETVKIKCPRCPKKFFKQETLDDHLERSHEPKLKCPHCPRDYIKKENLDTHIRNVHKKGKKPKPYRPNLRVMLAKVKKGQVPSNSGDKGPQCPWCRKRFASLENVEKHLKNVHTDDKINCPKCRRQFAKQETFENHMREHHPVKYDCKRCVQKFLQPELLDLHMKQVHPENKLRCPNCSKTFVRQARLDAHIIEKHEKCNEQNEEKGESEEDEEESEEEEEPQ